MQRQTPKQIQQTQKAIRRQRYQRIPVSRSAGPRFGRVDSPDCRINYCSRSCWVQPTTEPDHFIGEKWTSPYGRVFTWEFVDITAQQQFCELHHKDVMIAYLFRQLKFGVI